MAKKVTDTKILGAVAKHFDKFHESENFSEILNNFTGICELLEIQPTHFVNFYPDLKENVKSIKCSNLFKLLEERAKNPIFSENMAASNTRMVVVGAGPIGLRTAIEAQLLGARVTVIEKRTSFTRNNVLHLWPWTIEDLKSLGAKHFFPRFCTGTMNHISIKRLQCILLKAALVMGVEIVPGVEFNDVLEPETEMDSWKLSVKPLDHAINNRGIDVVIGAEGKHVTVPGFRRKEFRGKLAIAITANFKNMRTTAEATVEEISGVAFVYKQDFFNNLYDEFGIALENIVYYKDDTHYFVMTTKKHSLLDRKVLKKDLNDPIALLSPKNVNKENLLEYIRDACDYCTDYQLPHLEFAMNHHGEPDVALFDFTSMFAAGFASHVMEKKNKQLLFGLVGDGLLEPFWPTGTGIARGFLGGLDAVWMVRQWAAGDMTPVEIMEEREAILKLLPQTTPENLTKDYKNISIEPRTRYPNIPIQLIRSQEVRHQYKSDTPNNADVPRYRHPGFQEVSTKYQLRKSKPKPISLDSLRISRDSTAKDRQNENAQNDATAADFLKAMRDKRRNEINAERELKVNKNPSPDRKSRVKSSPVVPPDPSAQTMTLKERIEARRAALDQEGNGDKSENKKNIMNDVASKAEFVRKMSKTFGYGMPSNAESKPDTLTSEAEKCALLVKSASNKKNNINKPKRRKSGDQEKTKKTKQKTSATRDRVPDENSSPRIQTWDFSKMQQKQQKTGSSGLHSSVAPIVPELDIEIDPELDFLLAELEHDEGFSKLGENEQKAWLESLFFQDTTHLPGRVNNPRDQLNPTKSKPKNTLRVNRDAGGAGSDEPESESVTAVHVNDKMKNLAQDFFKVEKQTNRNSLPAKTMSENVTKSTRKLSDSGFETKSLLQRSSLRSSISKEDSPSTIPSPTLSRKSSVASYSTPPTSRKSSEVREQRNNSIEESCDRISGVNDSLCSLAQSYFSSPQKPVSRKPSIKEDTGPKDEEEKASLVASFFGGGKPSNSVNTKTSAQVPERASYEPEGQTIVSDDDDDEIEKLIKAAEAEMKLKREEAPPPPTRSADSKAMAMMKRLGNVTRIMQNGK